MEIQRSREIPGWIRIPGQAVTVLPGHQRNSLSCVILGGDDALSADQVQMLFLTAAFSWSNWEQYLLELIILQQELIKRTPIPPHIKDQLLWMKTGLQVSLVVVHFACLTISSLPHHCTVSIFHHPIRFVLKTEHFYYLSLENCMWKDGREGFSLCLWGTQTSQWST